MYFFFKIYNLYYYISILKAQEENGGEIKKGIKENVGNFYFLYYETLY